MSKFERRCEECGARVRVDGRTLCAQHHYYARVKAIRDAAIKTCRECGRNLRKDVAERGVCGACYRRTVDTDRLRYALLLQASPLPEHMRLAGRLCDQGVDTATRLGHHLDEPVTDDGPCTWIAKCKDCGLFMVVDTIEDRDSAYGSTQSIECPGEVRRVAAVRRDMMALETVTSAASQEWPDNEYVDTEGSAVSAAYSEA